MNSQFNREKTASSALIFAALGMLAVSISPAIAAPGVKTTTTIESSNQGFSASTDLDIVTDETETALADFSQAIEAGASEESPVATDWLLVTNDANNASASSKSPVALKTNIPVEPELTVADKDTSAGTLSLPEANVKDLTPASLQASKDPNVQPTNASPSLDELGSESSNSESPDDEVEANDPMDQVTNVSQLRDVRPGDWAYEALRELVERYGCIAGYPDGTYRGNRAMTRYEFAAGLRACLGQIEKLIAVSTTDFARKQDLESLRRLTQEFQAEIATLGTRVDRVEGRVGFLEARQFSTTTKLFGQAIVGVQGRNSTDYEFFDNQRQTGNRSTDRNNNVNVITNVQLSLLTQFSPRSILLTGLQAGNGFTRGFNDDLNLNNYARLGYEGNTNNSVVISDLTYRQLIGDNFAFIVGTEGVNAVNVFRGANRVESAGSGPLSLFAQRNPVIGIGAGRSGIGFDWQISDPISLQAVYSANLGFEPARGGIFGGTDGETSIGAQLSIEPTDNISLAVHYINAYSPFGRLGAGVGDDTVALALLGRAPIKTNAFGASVEWRISPRFTIGGWGGYATSDLIGQSGSVETINWMGFLSLPDLFGRGNVAGLYVGQPPKITSSSLPEGFNVPDTISRGNFPGRGGGQRATTIHTEAFYRFRVADNISITPGVIVIFNPGQNRDNDTTYIGAIRTTFSF